MHMPYQFGLIIALFFIGLLAGLWEFPSLLLEPGQEKQQKVVLADHLQAWVASDVAARHLQYVGEVTYSCLLFMGQPCKM